MQSQPKVDTPNISKEFEKGIKVYMKYLPKQLQQELQYRGQYDPLFTKQALQFQNKFDPTLAKEQKDAVARRDPQWLGIHEGLGSKISEALKRGYVDPRQEAAYQKMSELAGKGDATRDKLYGALGTQYRGDVGRGGTMSPEVLRQTTQAIMARQPNLSYGEAQDMATAVYTGQRGEQLKQQRQQGAGQFLNAATPEQQREASLSGFYGQQAPEMQAYGLAGTYLQPSNTVANMIGMTPGVQAPRTFGYVNPNAGWMGVQQGNVGFQQSLAAQGVNGGGGGNPWMNALSGAATGAQYGSVGGGYGAAGGAVTGAAAGLFGYPQYSDERLKQNISRTGLSTPDGISIVDYDYNGKRWRGVLAQEVQTVRPDAVYAFPGGTLGVFYDRLGIKVAEINQDEQEDV